MAVTKIPLAKPVKAHGEEITEIVLRDVTAEDIIDTGLPTLIIPSEDGESAGIEIRQKIIARYIVKLGGVPMSTVRSLSVADLSKCQAEVMRFFGEGAGEA